MHFANSDAMTYGILIVVMIVAMIGYWIWKQRLKKTLGHLPMIEAMSDEHSARRQIASGVLVILGAALMLVALVQPQWGQTDRMIKRTGIDVVFALDLSRSMLARDVSPSRLQAAKNEIETTLERLGGQAGDFVLVLLGRRRGLASQFDGGLHALVRRRHRCTAFDLTQHVACELADRFAERFVVRDRLDPVDLLQPLPAVLAGKQLCGARTGVAARSRGLPGTGGSAIAAMAAELRRGLAPIRFLVLKDLDFRIEPRGLDRRERLALLVLVLLGEQVRELIGDA